MTISLQRYAPCFDTLSNELRLHILEQLSKRPLNVEQLAKKLNAERSRVSHSLKMLRDCHYVEVSPKGKERVYQLRKGVLDEVAQGNVFKYMDAHIADYCNFECRKEGGTHGVARD